MERDLPLLGSPEVSNKAPCSRRRFSELRFFTLRQMLPFQDKQMRLSHLLIYQLVLFGHGAWFSVFQAESGIDQFGLS
jgi:hypothetical protein